MNLSGTGRVRRLQDISVSAGIALDVWSYSAMIKGYVQSSDLDSALEVLQAMKQAQHVLPNEVCAQPHIQCSSSQQQHDSPCLVIRCLHTERRYWSGRHGQSDSQLKPPEAQHDRHCQHADPCQAPAPSFLLRWLLLLYS